MMDYLENPVKKGYLAQKFQHKIWLNYIPGIRDVTVPSITR